MRAIQVVIIGAAGLAALLAGCSSAPRGEAQKPAAVEDRKPAPDTARPVQTEPVRPVDVARGADASKLGPLKDPANILSRRSIYYDLDRFDVRDEFRALVQAHAVYLRDNPTARMLVQGNTDERGSREYNVSLGQRRSEGVKKMLILLGARDGQVETVSLGEEKPQDAGHGEAAWAKNRRCDMLYAGEY